MNEKGSNYTKPMVENFRPIQPLAGREILNCKTNDTEEDADYIFGEPDDGEDHHDIRKYTHTTSQPRFESKWFCRLS